MSFLGLHSAIERHTGLLIFGILVVASIGGLVQVLPTTLDDALSIPSADVVPYPPLELLGRDIYIRESCSTCHSQQVRPLRRRSEALWSVRGLRRVRVRPPVPLGLEANRPRLAAPRRQVHGRVAPRAHERSSRRGPRIDHARVPVARRAQSRRERRHPGPASRAASARRSLFRRGRGQERRPRSRARPSSTR